MIKNEPTLILRARLESANPRGDIFGGWLMAQMDIAASVPAARRAQGAVTTAAVKDIRFIKPVFVGDLLRLYAEIVDTGASSMTVHVDVVRESVLHEGTMEKVAQGDLIFVAISDLGKPRRLPKCV
ncbi:MAG: acyl-CoA thioesterase [Gammaproteobacteria bacterium CG11_big_fil_rev_8_21_14_0_20_46_22]|nr:MAG: acyl-CoA thioesterase [Gammaproteobacteria bacterium CG12_big_fil_rev_8_21_14_0_65_46_12]PIR11418.1 MAG: acyl-CoA thioesterase [Gammaproteobacteria bacterium CG11_big_fil_rev_8_21_14_0_20_46_22]